MYTRDDSTRDIISKQILGGSFCASVASPLRPWIQLASKVNEVLITTFPYSLLSYECTGYIRVSNYNIWRKYLDTFEYIEILWSISILLGSFEYF